MTATHKRGVHANSFHASIKAWLFLRPVTQEMAPSPMFISRPNGWNENIVAALLIRKRSTGFRRVVAAGRSGRVGGHEAGSGRSPAAGGKHASGRRHRRFNVRGPMLRTGERMVPWSYARRSPLLSWLGWDILSLPGIAEAADRLADGAARPVRTAHRATSAAGGHAPARL